MANIIMTGCISDDDNGGMNKLALHLGNMRLNNLGAMA